MKFKYNFLAGLLCLLAGTRIDAQCVLGFTHTFTPPALYNFTNISVDYDTTQTITWSVSGPNVVYVSSLANPSFYFPVNGTYYIILSIPGCNYLMDSIIVSGLTITGTCNARLSYYPTFASNFEFDDASTASDSIINYVWHGNTYDNFMQVNGWDKNSDLSLWSYNGCHYGAYKVTHTITTISGCQSTILDTVSTYCDCQQAMRPAISFFYDSTTRQLIFSDSISAGVASSHYWRFQTNTQQYYTDSSANPVFNSLTDTIIIACDEVYDSSSRCTAQVCDSVHAFIVATGIKDVPFAAEVQIIVFPGSIQIRYSNIELKRAEIYDVQGKLIRSDYVNSSPASIILPPISAGIYFVRLISNESVIGRKILVK
ncbi:MAG: hypothetical protein JWO06_462 [Bacteroidota bacterium]|nr:hypothetical protein [Bacteroidota bacterium]